MKYKIRHHIGKLILKKKCQCEVIYIDATVKKTPAPIVGQVNTEEMQQKVMS